MRRLRDTLIFVAAAAAVAVPAVALGLAVSAALLATPSTAVASPQSVIRDCAQDGRLDHHYSSSDLRKAEQELPTDVDEYTNCRDVINQAEVSNSGRKSATAHAAAGGGGGSRGGGGGAASPKDVKALGHAQKRAATGAAPSLSLQGHEVQPGSSGVFRAAGAANSLPLPVLLALIALAALAAAGGVVALRRRFPEVVGAALRVFRR